MTDPDDDRDPLDRLAEEFLARFRKGERPAVSEFAARAPGQAAEVRELLSALLMVEGLKPRSDRTLDYASRAGVMGVGPDRERLGDYRILRELGRGGMGVVYEAEQVSLGRRVALKVLSPSSSRTTQQVQRFLREARSAAQLHHTNIVPVFGVGDQDGLYYYAMQFIGGQGLDKVLDEVKRLRGRSSGGAAGDESATRVGPLVPEPTAISRMLASGRFDPESGADGTPSAPPVALPGEPSLAMATDSEFRYARSVARVGVQVAEALEYAHHRGTLHRDIKPSNLLLDLKGNVWVADFGLAKAAEDDDLTQTGDLVGTLRYMAPERFRGICDARSDVHALGLTLYELLALRPAFEASGREGLIYQMTEKEPPRLRALNPAIPRDLETIVHKAIERAPGDRYPTARALAEDLRCFLEHRPIEARRVGSPERLTRWARRNPGLATLGTAVAGLLALTVLVIAAADLRLRGEHAQALANLRRAETAEDDAVAKLLESSLAQARAGRMGGMAGRRFDGLRALAEAARRDVGSRRLVALRNEAIACLALADLRPAWRRAAPPEDAHLGLDFDPSQPRLARGTAGGEILIEDLPTGRVLARLPGDGRPAVLVRFGPDGRSLAAKYAGRDGHVEFAVYDVGRRACTLRIPDGVYADAVDFHPDGRTVAAGRRDGSIVVHDLASGRQERRLPPATVPQAIRFDPSGLRIAVASPNSDQAAQVRDATSGEVLAEWRRPEGARALAWHPGGRWLAAGGFDGRVHLLDPSAPALPPRLLEGHDESVVSLAAHPGGDLLASASWDGTVRIWDARTAREVVKGPLPDARSLRFSRDGRFLGPGQDGASSWLWELAEGRELRSLVGPEGSGSATWSVDFSGRDGVLASAGATGIRLESTGRSAAPAFAPMPGTKGVAVAPDGSFLLTSGWYGLLRWPVSRPAAGEMRIGPPAPEGSMGGLATGRLRLSRDGRTLAVVEDDERGRVVVLDPEGARRPVELAGHAGLERLDLSPDGRWAATGTGQGTGVKVWDARRGTLVADLPVEGGADVAFGPDGRLLVTGSGAEYVLWEVGSWAPRHRFPRDQAGGQPGKASFSPDGRLLALELTRSHVQLVDPATGRDLATLEPPGPQHVSGLGFSPDGRLLAMTFNADAIRVWDLEAVRGGLAEVGLDWAGPPLLPAPRAEGPPLAIVVEPARWPDPFQDGDRLARAGRWADAASRYRDAIDAGAPGVDPRCRLAMSLLILGDQAGYREACRRLVREFGAGEMTFKTANNIAWLCALGPGSLDDYDRAIAMAGSAAASLPATNRLNTLGAILYRAGRFDEAIRQLDRSVAAHGAGGTPYDALFFAMAHHRLGHADEARAWLRRASEPAPIAMVKPDASGPSSWVPRVEIEALRREATTLVESPGR